MFQQTILGPVDARGQIDDAYVAAEWRFIPCRAPLAGLVGS